MSVIILCQKLDVIALRHVILLYSNMMKKGWVLEVGMMRIVRGLRVVGCGARNAVLCCTYVER